MVLPPLVVEAEPVLGLRVLTGVVAVPTLIAVVVLGGAWSLAAVLAGVVVGSLELFSLLRAAGYRPLAPLGLAVTIGVVLDPAFPQLGILQVVFPLGAVAAVAWLMQRDDWSGAIVDWALTFVPALYIGGLLRFFVPLRELPDGVLWALIVLVATWSCDTAAYFVGGAVGRTKLAPSISPAKSVEGAVGGVAAAVVVSMLAAPIGGVGVARLIGLGLTIGLCAILGDLIESFVKRQLGAKDSGEILPGHGGMLDRIDGLMLAVAGAYTYVVATA